MGHGNRVFLAGISEMINYTSFMAIFNSRVGTQYLPMMYLIEAILLPLEGWLLSFFSQRISKPRFMVGLYSFYFNRAAQWDCSAHFSLCRNSMDRILYPIVSSLEFCCSAANLADVEHSL